MRVYEEIVDTKRKRLVLYLMNQRPFSFHYQSREEDLIEELVAVWEYGNYSGWNWG